MGVSKQLSKTMSPDALRAEIVSLEERENLLKNKIYIFFWRRKRLMKAEKSED